MKIVYEDVESVLRPKNKAEIEETIKTANSEQLIKAGLDAEDPLLVKKGMEKANTKLLLPAPVVSMDINFDKVFIYDSWIDEYYIKFKNVNGKIFDFWYITFASKFVPFLKDDVKKMINKINKNIEILKKNI